MKTLEQFVAASQKWPRVTRKLVEDKANGSAIIATLKRKVSGIIPITPKESKEARASAVTTLWEAKSKERLSAAEGPLPMGRKRICARVT